MINRYKFQRSKEYCCRTSVIWNRLLLHGHMGRVYAETLSAIQIELSVLFIHLLNLEDLLLKRV